LSGSGFAPAALFFISGFASWLALPDFGAALCFAVLLFIDILLSKNNARHFSSKNDNFFPRKDKRLSQMPRKLLPGRLIVASHNAGKVQEINELLAPYAIAAVSAGEMGLTEPEETEKSFLGNALLKARAAAAASGLPALADDSGLVVAALGGAPGVYSARWAGENRDFAVAMARVEKELQAIGAEDRSARFVCALALAWPDGRAETFEGEVRGTLVFPPRGTGGFGYDPIFLPAGEDQTFGEMAPEKKHKISHRAAAFRKLIRECIENA
jgi:XTP/dITP diphosphohydrolase